MEKIYVVEDVNSGEFYGFKSIEAVRNWMLKVYREDFQSWYTNPSESTLIQIADDLGSILSDYPYVEDVFYTREIHFVG